MRRAGLVLVVAALGFVRHLPLLSDPWDRSAGAINGAWYMAQPVRNWERLGFAATRGMPLLAAAPTTPPAGTPYTHHPPAFPWLIYAAVSRLGWSEASFRLVPAVFAALSGALIVVLALGRGGLGFAAACGALWLALPMSFLFGSMCNPESATLFFMLLTFVLHDRLRAAPWPWYALPVASQFAAGQMDWQGCFAVPAIFLWELCRRREGPRIARVFALGVASVVSVFVVTALLGFFVETAGKAYEAVKAGAGGAAPPFEAAAIPRYLATGVGNAFATSEGSVAKGTSAAQWIAWQRENVPTFFTWAAAALTAAGAAIAIVRRTPALVLGLVLVVPGLLNVGLFRAHAGHEFWLWYATPGVAIVAAEVLRLVLRRPHFAGLGLAAVIACCAWNVREVLGRWRTTDLRDAGRELDRLADRPDDILVVDHAFAPTTFYTRPWVLDVPVTPNKLHELRDLKMAGRIPNTLVFLVAGKPDAASPDAVDAALGRFGRVRRLDAAEVAAGYPVSSRLIAPGPWWVVRVE